MTSNTWAREAQARTLPAAVARGDEWAAADVELVAGFPECTAEELALAVGRTVYAIQSLRERLEQGEYQPSGKPRPKPAPAFRFTFAKGWRD